MRGKRFSPHYSGIPAQTSAVLKRGHGLGPSRSTRQRPRLDCFLPGILFFCSFPRIFFLYHFHHRKRMEHRRKSRRVVPRVAPPPPLPPSPLPPSFFLELSLSSSPNDAASLCFLATSNFAERTAGNVDVDVQVGTEDKRSARDITRKNSPFGSSGREKLAMKNDYYGIGHC